MNERLPAYIQQIYSDARRTVREGRLYQAWIQNGAILVKRYSTTSPIRLRHRERLSNITSASLRLAITHSFSLRTYHLSYSLPLYSSEISALLSSVPHLGSTQFLHAPAFTSHSTILSRSTVHASAGDCCFWRMVLFAW